MRVFEFRIVRWGIALWMAHQAISCLFDGCFVLSYKLHLWGFTRFLGLRTEGDDYRRFIPLMDATPIWRPGLALLAGVLYVAVVVQVLRQSRSAFTLSIGALALSAGPWIHAIRSPLFAEAFSSAHMTRDVLLYAVTALLCVALWQHSQTQNSLAR